MGDRIRWKFLLKKLFRESATLVYFWLLKEQLDVLHIQDNYNEEKFIYI